MNFLDKQEKTPMIKLKKVVSKYTPNELKSQQTPDYYEDEGIDNNNNNNHENGNDDDNDEDDYGQTLNSYMYQDAEYDSQYEDPEEEEDDYWLNSKQQQNSHTKLKDTEMPVVDSNEQIGGPGQQQTKTKTTNQTGSSSSSFSSSIKQISRMFFRNDSTVTRFNRSLMTFLVAFVYFILKM